MPDQLTVADLAAMRSKVTHSSYQGSASDFCLLLDAIEQARALLRVYVNQDGSLSLNPREAARLFAHLGMEARA